MNRILLATICGIILGAIIISMASRDRYVDADSLRVDANSNTTRFGARDSISQSGESGPGANPAENSRLTNAQAPRSGRARTGTTRGRDRSAFDTDPSTGRPLVDTVALNAERTREALRIRQERREQRQQAQRSAELIMQQRRQQAIQAREQRQQRLADIQARTNQMMATNSLATPTSLANGVSAEVAQAMQTLADTITEQGDGSSPFSASSALSGDLIGDLVGAITAEMDNNGGSNLLSLLQNLGFGDILNQSGLTGRDLITLGQRGLGEFIFENARPKTVWIPVERSRNSRELNTTRTNDLFIVYPTPTMVTVVESPADTGLHVTGGSFVQIEGGDNGPTSLNPSDIRAYDSFLTLNGQSPAFAGSEPSSSDWGSEIEASWFSVPPQPGAIDPDRFGDSRTYVWIGRFTVKADEGATPVVSGRIKSSSLKLLTGEINDQLILVEADPAIWTPLDELAPTAPRLKSFRSRTGIVEAGQQITTSPSTQSSSSSPQTS
ncbi:MAG: hypothetical protein ACYTF7_03205 [Planctomycetota bacterium]|jgi:hypothetical protein